MWVLRPKAQLSSVTELTPQWLFERGLRAVLLDLDNTLVPYNVYGEAPTELLDWLSDLQGAGIEIRLVSNALAGRVRYWREKLGVEGYGPAGKPWFGYSNIIRELELRPEEVAVVGDQVFSDVLGGNLAGAYTVLVSPLSNKDMIYTRLVRKLEALVLGRKQGTYL